MRAFSSAGRAPRLHRGCRRFDPGRAHSRGRTRTCWGCATPHAVRLGTTVLQGPLQRPKATTERSELVCSDHGDEQGPAARRDRRGSGCSVRRRRCDRRLGNGARRLVDDRRRIHRVADRIAAVPFSASVERPVPDRASAASGCRSGVLALALGTFAHPPSCSTSPKHPHAIDPRSGPVCR